MSQFKPKLQTVPLLIVLVLTLAMVPSSFADDAEIAARLTAIGGKVTLKNGVASQVTFTDCSKVGEPELKTIVQLAHLRSLTLYGKAKVVNDQTASLLLGLKELESLSTDGAQLSDEGLKTLAGLTSLKSASFFHLSFRMEGFTGKGFVAWKSMPSLERLTVAGMSMGDDGYAAIGTLTQLRELSTWHTYITEAGNAHIAKLSNLTKLRIGQRLPHAGAKETSLSDTSLRTFAGMTTLESLEIGEAKFTAAALTGLKSLPKLKQLTLFETDLSPADIEAVRLALPGVKVEFKPLTDEQRKKLESYLK